MLGAQGTHIEEGWRMWRQELISAGGWLHSSSPEKMDSRDSQLNSWELCSCPLTAWGCQAGVAVRVVSITATALLGNSPPVSAELAPQKLQTAVLEQMVVCLAAPKC